MKKLSALILSASFGLLVLPTTACNPSLILNPSVISQTATKYALPLKLTQTGECDLPSQTVFEVGTDGNFRYLLEETPGTSAAPAAYKTRKLSEDEKSSLLKLLSQLDLVKQDLASKAIPDNAPQTEECRTVEQVVMQVNGQTRSFDRNGRKFTHSNEYLAAFEKLQKYLKDLRQESSPQASPSPISQGENKDRLPLKLEAQGECEMGTQLRYEVSRDGRFSYLPDAESAGGNSNQVQVRHLSNQDLLALNDLLQSLNLSQLRASSVPVPEDAPQTMECRTIQNLSLNVSGQTQVFDRNGRKFSHSQAYLKAFDQLIDHLNTLQKKYAYLGRETYALPLRVLVEGECGLESYPRFALSADGHFSWAIENAQTLVAGPPPQASKQLSPAEIASVTAFINQKDLLKLALESEPIPPDAPQTKECRSIEKIELSIDGQTHTLEGKGSRNYHHSEVFLTALKELSELLSRLSK